MNELASLVKEKKYRKTLQYQIICIMKHGKYAIIIGAMKSGTSSLYEYVSRHPNICKCCTKEPEFFSTRQDHGIDTRRYEELWDFDRKKHEWLMEASTGYTKYPEEPCVPKNMYEYGIDAKFIYIIRDPVDRIESDFNYMRQHPNMDEGGTPLTENRIARSKYYLQISRFLNYFPKKERYLIVKLSNLKDSPSKVINEVFSFLEVDDFEPSEFGVYNDTERVSSAEQLFRRPGLYQLRKIIPAGLRRQFRQMLLSTTGSARYELTSKERRIARSKLSSDMDKLNREFDISI